MTYPLSSLYHWEPFKVDALGLITLLGAEEVNTWVGRLVRSRWVEYMPLLAMYVIAGDRFRTKTPSFMLYNISKGVHTTECAAWFTRWVQCQNFETNRSVVLWEATPKLPRCLIDYCIAIFVAVCSTGPLLAITILMYDMYGVANTCAIIVSILMRAYILSTNRISIDQATSRADMGRNHDKFLIITPGSTVITMFIPNELIVPVFVTNGPIIPRRLYTVARWINWLAFGIHVTTIGMASLATQIYTIGLILTSFMLVTRGFGCADTEQPIPVHFENGGHTQAYTCHIGSHLKATVFEWPSYLEFDPRPNGVWKFRDPSAQPSAKRSGLTRRQDLYAWLNLTPEEEASVSKWGLLPHKRGDDKSWDNTYNAKAQLIRSNAPNMWKIKRIIDQCLEGQSTTGKDGNTDIERQASGTNDGENIEPRNSL
ncbi:hypothetical protein N7507_004934 [Penicillium longicatenatum]|nr:hypothetical protein N7507_004934 [Penicillium longicatenatum]